MSEFIFITGGRRSGKSAYALDLAESMGEKRLYIATACALDDEMKVRIARHREERGDGWDTAEEPIDIVNILAHSKKYNVILIDCLTLWLCNIMHKDATSPLMGEGRGEGEMNAPLPSIPSHAGRGGKILEAVSDDKEILAMVDALADSCASSDTKIIAVTNELGLGVIPGDPLSRRFTDLAGIMNQRMAAAADRVVITVSGIPLTIKAEN